MNGKTKVTIFIILLLLIGGCVTVYKATDNASIKTQPRLDYEDDDTIDLFNHKKGAL